MRRRLGLAWLVCVASALFTGSGYGGSLQPLGDFGANPGNLDAFIYLPRGAGPGAALVVALHGCTQQAADFDDETGLEALADAVPFVLLLPQQRPENNPERCFNFFDRAHNRPGRGESASIMAMVDHAAVTYAIDRARVHVVGLSAGGGMTAVLLANHPERFAGGGIIAGLPFDCNRPTLMTSFIWWWMRTIWGEAAAASYACGIFRQAPIDRTPEDWGAAVRGLHGTAPSRWPIVSIWHGDADTIVHPQNRRELIDQWTAVHGIDPIADQTMQVGTAERQVFWLTDGDVRVEAWRLPQLDHAVPIDPAAEPEACGVVGPYMADAALCAMREIARFWRLLP